MPPPKRMTANPSRPARYRPGKATAADSSSEEDSDSEEEQEEAPKVAAPSASSFPKAASHITSNLQNVDLNARREAVRAEAARKAKEAEINEDEFETEESEASGSEGSESEEGSSEEEEEESSSEDEVAARRKLLRPVFVKKGARAEAARPKTEDERWAEEEERRKARANELVQAQLDKNAAAKAAGKKFWDDEDPNIEDEVDDTDDLDPEAERTAWKLRELQRIKRDRDALIAAEKEREEIDRRRNLSKEERDAEDKEFLDAQQAERDGKGKMGFMQKYYHKGAYFTEDLQEAGLDKRDIMGGRYVDDVANRDTLPEYMQIRDMTKLGKKGRTRYKDLKSEDTGRWGDLGGRRGKGGDFGGDERFRPDWDGGGRGGDGPSGANASTLGDRKRHAQDEREGEKRQRVD